MAEHFAKLLVVDIVRQILHVQIDALVFRCLLQARSLVLLAKLFLTFMLLLRTPHIESLAVEVFIVELLHSRRSIFMINEVDKAETAALAGVLIPRN